MAKELILSILFILPNQPSRLCARLLSLVIGSLDMGVHLRISSKYVASQSYHSAYLSFLTYDELSGR